MLLPPHEVAIFGKLHRALLFFVNDRLHVIPNQVASPEQFGSLDPQLRLKVQEALNSHLELIDSFVTENPARLSDEELDLVRSWKHLVAGSFYIFRQLKKYAAFLSTTSPAVIYGVVALTVPFERMVGQRLPARVETTLLPFKGAIIFDSLLKTYGVSFGPGIRQKFNEIFTESKARNGIVTSLPMSQGMSQPVSAPTSATPSPTKSPKPRAAPKPPTRDEKDEALQAVVRLLDQFCQEHLNEEYAELCRRLAEKLGRKRPSPLLRGQPNAWASGIVRAIGGVNFLHDKSQKPYMRSSDIDRCFGTSESSGAARLAAIRKMLKMYQGDPTWTLPSRLIDNPFVWMAELNGMLVDLRDAPRHIQELAFQRGLIPFIPERSPPADNQPSPRRE